ncbi:MAG: hypothetical protein OXG26_15205 [Caldilineaceae bacterium]|nr:hypothetical protein [Caldilineaceae bacterium]
MGIVIILNVMWLDGFAGAMNPTESLSRHRFGCKWIVRGWSLWVGARHFAVGVVIFDPTAHNEREREENNDILHGVAKVSGFTQL